MNGIHAGTKLRIAREAQVPPLSRREVAAYLDIPAARIQAYELERALPPKAVIEKVAQWWGLDVSWFWDGKDTMPHTPNASLVSSRTSTKSIPYWGLVPCGEWEMPSSDSNTLEITGLDNVDGIVAVRVSGNSMAPRLSHGQLVIVKLSPHPKPGVITLAHNQLGELTLKVLEHRAGGWALRSINPEYADATAEKWTILGYAIKLTETDTSGIRP